MRTASLKPMEPAFLNAISEESTAWYEPSRRLTLTSTSGIAGNDAALHRFPGALLHGGDVLTRDVAADDLVFEDEAGAALERLDLELDDTELAAAARSGGRSGPQPGQWW